MKDARTVPFEQATHGDSFLKCFFVTRCLLIIYDFFYSILKLKCEIGRYKTQIN